MGPWESVVVTIAGLAGVFFAVMGFRGLIETLDNGSGRCLRCGKAPNLPLPTQSHRCWRCHYPIDRSIQTVLARRQLHH